MTNFATWIDSANERAPIAQRGHAKQKRNDLRLVGLGLVVSVNGGIPLVVHAYPGNKPDVTQFGAMVKELAARFETLRADTAGPVSDHLTLVYDAGQNSDGNYELLDGFPLSFVGSLPPSDHPGLLAVGKERYQAVDEERFPGLVAFETRKAVFGKERRLVVCHSENLHAKQSRGFDQTLAKANRHSQTRRPSRPGKNPQGEGEGGGRDRPDPQAPVAVPGRLDPTGDSPAGLRLDFRVSTKARAALEAELFGKRILFSDKTIQDATTATIVAGYRSQEAVEADFRQMKDPSVVSFSPMFHWTESKIRVHVFYCVLALMVARLMVREAEHAGLHLSVRELLETLAGIEETVMLYQGERGRPRARRMLTEIDPPANASTTCSASRPTPPSAELGTTPGDLTHHR